MTYSHAFRVAVAATLEHEGGYVSNPRDPGGETNFGISKRVYPHLNIRDLTRDKAISIYYQDYWLPADLDSYPPQIAIVMFDSLAHGGRVRAWLQQAVGAVPDGRIGPQTRAALARSMETRGPVWIACEILRYRLAHLQALQPEFQVGWTRRLFRLAVDVGRWRDPDGLAAEPHTMVE